MNITADLSSLESRISARRMELIHKIHELKTDTRVGAVEARDKLKAKLSELAHIIKEGVVDGWTSLGDIAQRKLDHWLAESQPEGKEQSS
jgi:hypothetical protein